MISLIIEWSVSLTITYFSIKAVYISLISKPFSLFMISFTILRHFTPFCGFYLRNNLYLYIFPCFYFVWALKLTPDKQIKQCIQKLQAGTCNIGFSSVLLLIDGKVLEFREYIIQHLVSKPVLPVHLLCLYRFRCFSNLVVWKSCQLKYLRYIFFCFFYVCLFV